MKNDYNESCSSDLIKPYFDNFFCFSRMIDRIENWRLMSLNAASCSSSTTPDDDLSLSKGPESFKVFGEKMPDFPLIPASRGFCLSLDSSLEKFKTALALKAETSL